MTMKISEDLRDQVRATISNAYYDARNAGLTMETAADQATAHIVTLLEHAPLTPPDADIVLHGTAYKLVD